jgi:hypothetical protein
LLLPAGRCLGHSAEFHQDFVFVENQILLGIEESGYATA